MRPDTDCIVEAESRVAPAEKLADHHLVNPPLAEEQAKNALAEEVLQGIQINLRERDEPARRCERAVGHQGVQVRMEVDEVAIGLDGDDDARDVGLLTFSFGAQPPR